MITAVLCGFPCTNFSIAQRDERREKEPYSGLGWELFMNGYHAVQKLNPDIFFFENNHSIDPRIKAAVSEKLGVKNYMINSALLSAQNRKREYWFNWEVTQPEDKGIVVNDILESGMSWIEKSYCLTASYNGAVAWNTLERKQRTMVAEPVRLGDIGSKAQAQRVYSHLGKSVNLTANGGGQGAKTGLYTVPVSTEEIPQCRQVHHVENHKIELRGKIYDIALPDGDYVIRKLTPIEAERLQTLPDNYTKAVGTGARYKAVGNGWTADVVQFILEERLKDVPRSEHIVVVALYDGIATGRLVLDRMGFKNVTYIAFEIDKNAIAVAQDNYKDIIELGDAFITRENDFTKKIYDIAHQHELLRVI